MRRIVKPITNKLNNYFGGWLKVEEVLKQLQTLCQQERSPGYSIKNISLLLNANVRFTDIVSLDLTNFCMKDTPQSTNTDKKLTPLRCLTGALISGTMAIALYSLTSSIAQTYATKPINSSSPIAINIASAVRTLVVGASTLATFIFALAAVGLVALAGQIILQRLKETGDGAE